MCVDGLNQLSNDDGVNVYDLHPNYYTFLILKRIFKKMRICQRCQFRDEEGKKTGPFTWHAGKYQCNVILRFLAAINEVVDAQPPPRFTIQVKDDPKQLPEKQIENRVHRLVELATWLAKEENKKHDSPSTVAVHEEIQRILRKWRQARSGSKNRRG
ncbi:uncharacterized protein BJ212DRAFT_1299125 [Suillus subaureus]|uniref:Uncharacterized protein n=1 Tax=Suillus subaureus TaxID=48587 RepID=A0A9P7JEH3_9AGAM|nr:uncharacterized protein BJ212DRAFT_1299125 [Suillus subaureus]KAG1817584.1 hypothetical protein BJ212DRAFT_1299125 [Suillus subaureus]